MTDDLFIPEDPDTYFAVEMLEGLLFTVDQDGLAHITHALEHLARTGSIRLLPVEGGLN